jgi:hypothetical protein
VLKVVSLFGYLIANSSANNSIPVLISGKYGAENVADYAVSLAQTTKRSNIATDLFVASFMASHY